MSRNTRILSFSVPPEIAKKVAELAKKEQRTRSELLRRMIQVYEEHEAETQWKGLFAFGEETARRFNIRDEEELFRLLDEDTES